MSTSQTNYKLDEAQAIFNELRSIKKAISAGEKERQDLIQVGFIHCSTPFQTCESAAASRSFSQTSSGKKKKKKKTRHMTKPVIHWRKIILFICSYFRPLLAS